MSVQFSQEKLDKVNELKSHYPEGKHKSALIEVLHMAQEEYGWLDGMFTLKTVECLGACGYAPMMQMGKYYKEHLTPERIDQIVEECRKNSERNN